MLARVGRVYWWAVLAAHLLGVLLMLPAVVLGEAGGAVAAALAVTLWSAAEWLGVRLLVALVGKAFRSLKACPSARPGGSPSRAEGRSESLTGDGDSVPLSSAAGGLSC